MSLFGKTKSKPLPSGTPIDPNWARTPEGRFHRFLSFDPEEYNLSDVSAVYIIWHAGVRPEWVYVGNSHDLADDLNRLTENDEITDYEVNGGLFVSWSLVKDEFQDGVVRFIALNAKPVVENPGIPGKDTEAIPVFLPGTEPKEPAKPKY